MTTSINITFPITLLLFCLLLGCSTTPPPISKSPAPPVIKNLTPASQDTDIKVILLLPLSGPSEHVGRTMFDAAQLALFNANMPELTLLPIDTEEPDAVVATKIKHAIEQGAHIIIGPLFSQKTATVARIAKPYNMNIISFSNDKTLAGNGIFLMSFMLDEQIQRVTEYAISQGINDFYALLPSDAYGKLALERLRKIAVDNNGSLNRIEFYSPTGDGLDLAVKNIADALNNDKTPSMKALFVPEGGKNLTTITTLLSQYNVDKTNLHLIGTGQWDDKTSTHNEYLAGGWFASISPEQHNMFETSFEQHYGYKPLRIASLAYDAIALTFSIANQGNADFSQSTLTNPRGFLGVDGIFRLQENGITERKLAILQVEKEKFQVIDPAAEGFEKNAP